MAQDTFMATVYIFAGNFAPRCYQLCAGQILSIAQNTALFSLLGTTYGGNGQTTFGLPDLRGRLPIGAGQGPGLQNVDLGEVAGSANVSLTSNNLPAHNHTVTLTVNAAADDRAGASSPAGAYLDNGTTIFTPTKDGTTMAADMVTGVVGPTGGSQPFGVQNPYLGLNYIIATEGLFPSRN